MIDSTEPTPADADADRRTGIDPLLMAARVFLYVLLAGIVFAAIATVVAIVSHVATYGLPLRHGPWHPAWQPVSTLLFALGALWIVADSTLAVLGMIAAVGRGEAFEIANVARLERIAWNVIGLAILGIVAAIAGSDIRGDINGISIGVDAPTSIAFALLLFILARVFRQGAAMRADLEGTV